MLKLLHPCHCFLFHLIVISGDNADFITNAKIPPPVALLSDRYSGALPLWSCEWNAENQNYFYVGQQNGRVLEFDTRNTSAHLRELNSEGSQSPVVALQYMSRDINAAFKSVPTFCFCCQTFQLHYTKNLQRLQPVRITELPTP